MKVSILNIGDELLSGKTLNTNSFWIKRKLFSCGLFIESQITVQDETESIISGLNYCITKKPDYLITTGGLGPTSDDITRDVLFKYFNTKSSVDLKYLDFLKQKYGTKNLKINDSIKNQALIPNIGEVIPNSIGTARGLKFKKNSTVIFALPGVPNEMKKMFKKYILPQIYDANPNPFFSKTLRTCGISESKLYEFITSQKNCGHNQIGYYPSAYGVDIKITNYNNKDIESFIDILYKKFGNYIYAENEENLEKIIIDICHKQNQTLAVAESCTGGLIGHRITNVAGSSAVLKGGIIAYSNESKMNILGLKKNTLDQYGSVSEETALSMSERVKKLFNCSIGLSATGIAGPGGGSLEKPLGLVYIGLATNTNTIVKKYKFNQDRKTNKVKTSQMALDLLRKGLLNE